MSAIMSDIKMSNSSKPKSKPGARTVSTRGSFTVREMNRQPAALLKACNALGAIIIRSRNGRTYRLIAEGVQSSDSGAANETTNRRHAALERMRRYHKAVDAISAPHAKWTSAQIARLNAVIAGED